MAEVDNGEILAQLVGITGCDEDQALTLLQATDWNLEQAVNLHFAAGPAGAAAAAGPSGAGGGGGGAGGGAGRSSGLPPDLLDEEEVRAPLPSKVDRLYGDAMDTAGGVSDARARMMAAHGWRPNRLPSQHVDVFRDAKAESASAPYRHLLPTAGGGGGAGGAQPSGAPTNLSDMFRPPLDLLFKGDPNTAGQVAATENRWLLFNVQSSTEFASHQLNRDTWTHALVKDMVARNFLFLQLQDSSPEGKKTQSTYRLARLPVILVVDPLTSAKLYEKAGFVDPEKLLEDLVPFLDHGPQDPGAGDLAKQNLQRRVAALPSPALGSSPAVGGGVPGRAAAGAGGGGGGAGGKGMTEDEELALAIAMSMEQGAAGGRGGGAAASGRREQSAGRNGMQSAGAMSTAPGTEDGEDEDDDEGAGNSDNDDDDGDEDFGLVEEEGAGAGGRDAGAAAAPPPPPQLTPEQVQAAAAGRLPAEPAEGAPDVCRVAIRLPSGQRLTRRFRMGDTVQALQDFVVVHFSEAASGRPFHLSMAGPGAKPLTDMGQSLQAANVHASMLVVAWAA